MVDPTTRRVERTPVTLKIKFKSETLDQFIERYAVDVSPGGIFIRTKEPLTVGTPMKFEFQLRDASPLIAGEGTVVWTRDNDPSRPAVAPGMGVRFDRLAEGSQGVIDKILVEKAKHPPRPASDTARPFMDSPTRVAPLPGSEGQRTASPSRPFMDTPTRVAPLAMPEALFNNAARAAGQRPGRTTPFQPDAGEFSPGAFEEATKVRSLEDLVAQTGQAALFARPSPTPSTPYFSGAPAPAGEPQSLRDLGSSSHLPIPAPSEPAGNGERIDLPAMPRRPTTAPPRPRTSSDQPPFATHSDALSETAPAESRMGAYGVEVESASLPERAKRPSSLSPPERTKRPSSLPPLASPNFDIPAGPSGEPASPRAATPAVKRSSRAPTILALLAVAGVGTGIWYFIFRDTTPVAATTAVGDPPTATESAAGASATSSTAPITAAPSRPMTETEIRTSLAKATVTVLETGQTGPAPLTANLEKDKKYAVRIEAAGYARAEIEVVGGQEAVTATLSEKPHVLIVSSDPDGAQVFINNAPTGKVTPATIELTASLKAKPRLRLQLRRAGYRWVDRIVDVTGNLTEDDARMTLSVEVPLVIAPGTESGTRKADGAAKPEGAPKSEATPKSEGTPKPDGEPSTGSAPRPSEPTEHAPDAHAEPNKP